MPSARDDGFAVIAWSPATAIRAIAVAYSSQCDRDTLISPTPALVAASRMAPDRMTEGAPRGSLAISMDRQGSGPSHAHRQRLDDGFLRGEPRREVTTRHRLAESSSRSHAR